MISDDDIEYTLSANMNSVDEGSSITYTLTADSTSSSNKTFTYQVEGDDISGSVNEASSNDYSTSSSQTFTIQAGSSSSSFSVTAKNDTLNEPLGDLR